MDEGDYGQQVADFYLDLALQNRRSAQQTPSTSCYKCGIELSPHRVAHGTCIECQSRIERESLMFLKRQAI